MLYIKLDTTSSRRLTLIMAANLCTLVTVPVVQPEFTALRHSKQLSLFSDDSFHFEAMIHVWTTGGRLD